MGKGQAAMEFLMTYGWALLVILIVIAALVGFGILYPDLFLPSMCQLTPGIACLDDKIDNSDGQVVLRIKNYSGYTISLISFWVLDDTSNIQNFCDGTAGALQSNVLAVLDDGEEQTLTATCSSALPAPKTKISSDVQLDYTVNNLQHSKIGRLVTTIEV